jgi:hypothetical protein
VEVRIRTAYLYRLAARERSSRSFDATLPRIAAVVWGGGGNHPGYALGCWLRDHADQVWLFTRQPAVDWTNNVCERGAKTARRHQAVSGYWHSQRTLARWCRTRSYLDSATAHGLSPLGAITVALAGKPWLPATPAAVPITA